MSTTSVKRLLDLAVLAGDSALVRSGVSGLDDDAVLAARGRLARRMQELRGLPQKIGQFFVEADGQGPYDLLAEAPSTMDPKVALAAIERSLGRPLADVFRTIEGTAIAASLGQVHRAVTSDGRTVAVKLQYPDVADSVKTDLSALSVLAAPIGGFGKSFDLAAYRVELAAMLAEELDYVVEAQRMRELGWLVAFWPDVRVPAVIPELSSSRLLVMEWAAGEPFHVTEEFSHEERTAIATTLVRLFQQCLLRWGFVHCDPHSGNYRFQRRPEASPVVWLLDFGCVKKLAPDFVETLRALVRLAQREGAEARPDVVLSGYVQLGFERDLLEPMASVLPALNALLFEPFREGLAFDIERWNLQERLSEVLGKYRHNFRVAGPPALIFLIRAYRGLVGYLRALRARVDWTGIFEDVCRGTKMVVLAPIRERAPSFSTEAQALRVRVLEDAQIKVDLTFRAALVEDLHDIMPDELLPKLDERGIDVIRIANEAIERGVVPQELFRLDDAQKSVRVWLE